MKIGIDARLIQQTGVGRYIQNLLSHIADLDGKNEYIIYLGEDSYDSFILPSCLWQKRLVKVRWHTLGEQLLLPWIYKKDTLDLLHVPYFTVPLLYPGKMVLTIHDLTILHIFTGRATQLPLVWYAIKWLAYYFLLWIGVREANHILTVSHTTKEDIISSLGISKNKITVTYEGFRLGGKQLFHKRMPKVTSSKKTVALGAYILYVGNAYPHKNLDYLVEGYCLYRKNNPKQRLSLVLVGKSDVFYERLQKRTAMMDYTKDIVYFGEADDTELAALYADALAFVFPSRFEGFGLPAIEALAEGCPVICSDIAVFRELLGSLPVYVDPQNPQSLVEAITKVAQSPKMYKPQAKHWQTLAQTFDWRTLAVKTLAVYQKSQW